jgi:hypothetical protein
MLQEFYPPPSEPVALGERAETALTQVAFNPPIPGAFAIAVVFLPFCVLLRAECCCPVLRAEHVQNPFHIDPEAVLNPFDYTPVRPPPMHAHAPVVLS